MSTVAPRGCRYKKLSAFTGASGPRLKLLRQLKLPKPELRIWVYRMPSLLVPLGGDQTYWRARFVKRRARCLAALGCAPSGCSAVEGGRKDRSRCCCLASPPPMGAMSRDDLSWQRAEDENRPHWSWHAISGPRLRWGHLIKGR